MLELAAEETQLALDYARGNACSTVTKGKLFVMKVYYRLYHVTLVLLNLTIEEYKIKRENLANRLKELFDKRDSDDEDITEEIQKLSEQTIGEPTKALVGKIKLLKNEPRRFEMAQDMIKKLIEDKRERKQHMKELKSEKKQRREKMREEKDKKNKEREEKEREEFERKQQMILEKIENRKNLIKQSKTQMIKETKKRVRKSPLHAKIEHSFEESYVMPELEKRKQVLSQIRNFHQPIRLTNIKEHSEQKKILLQEKLKEYFEKREDYAIAAKDTSDKYNSYFWKTVNTREAGEEQKKLEEQEAIRNRHQKSIDYAKNAMALYKPPISKKKKLEMELIRQNMNDPHALRKVRKGTNSVKAHNNSVHSPLYQGISAEINSQQTKRRKLSKTKPLDDKRYSYHPTPHDKHGFIKHDYLTKKRLAREEKEPSSTMKSIDNWQNSISKANLNDEERIEFIKIKSALMEEEMKRKEAIMKASNTSTLDETRKIDGLLINSIRTKLDLISGIS